MDDPIYSYFSENLVAISKGDLLQAQENALRSANYWRNVCLLRCFSTQTRSGGVLGTESNLHSEKYEPEHSRPGGAATGRLLHF